MRSQMDRIHGTAAKEHAEKINISVSHPRMIDQYQSMSSPADRVLHLQRTAGNRAVELLIKSGTLQAKLRISKPQDKYVPEADRVAGVVNGIPGPGVQLQPVEEEEIQTTPVTEQIFPLVQRQVEKEGATGMITARCSDASSKAVVQSRINMPPDVIAREETTEESAPVDVTDDTVYKVSDRKALLRTAPPALASTGRKILWDSQVKITQRFTKDGKSYVFAKKAYGDRADWGWTLESNMTTTDVPTDARYGSNEVTGYFIKNDKYLQQASIDALNNIDNPIQIKNEEGVVVKEYYLRLTECIYPSSFSHKSKGHYTGHCVDIAFADSSGTKIGYSGAGKSRIEEQGGAAFNSIYKHNDHFHGCVSLPSWVTARSTSQLKKLIKERRDEY